jgi:phosphinothricin acetyltransferase
MHEEDWCAVREIYQEGIATGNATFQTAAPEWLEWNEGHLQDCRYVATVDNRVVGWAALSPFSRRHAYRGVAELSIYVSTHFQGKGAGRALLSGLIKARKVRVSGRYLLASFRKTRPVLLYIAAGDSGKSAAGKKWVK